MRESHTPTNSKNYLHLLRIFSETDMQQMRSEEILYKGKPTIRVYFPYDSEIIQKVKKIESARWSCSKRAWLIDSSDQTRSELRNRFPGIEIKSMSRQGLPVEFRPTGEKKESLQQFERFLRSRRYNESTILTYTEALKIFLGFFGQKQVSEIDQNDLLTFNNNYILARQLSGSYQNQVVNAVKLFFRTLDNRAMNVDLIHRPRREKKLPNVLGKAEVKIILDATSNLKHKAMLSLIYACGLRRGELLNLEIKWVDSARNLLIVKQAKGKKDRVVPLSQKIIELLRLYYLAYRPKLFLFEGQSGGRYSEKSLESVLKNSLAKTAIKKPVTLHWLRHSYATHLLENGTDIRYIQELLGHSSTRTTEIYTHVSTHNIQQIKSPFDDL
jgi:integrase/recombinase XerD